MLSSIITRPAQLYVTLFWFAVAVDRTQVLVVDGLDNGHEVWGFRDHIQFGNKHVNEFLKAFMSLPWCQLFRLFIFDFVHSVSCFCFPNPNSFKTPSPLFLLLLLFYYYFFSPVSPFISREGLRWACLAAERKFVIVSPP